MFEPPPNSPRALKCQQKKTRNTDHWTLEVGMGYDTQLVLGKSQRGKRVLVLNAILSVFRTHVCHVMACDSGEEETIVNAIVMLLCISHDGVIMYGLCYPRSEQSFFPPSSLLSSPSSLAMHTLTIPKNDYGGKKKKKKKRRRRKECKILGYVQERKVSGMVLPTDLAPTTPRT
jgi:hypothetical protein